MPEPAMPETDAFSPQDCLIALMVALSASDGTISENENRMLEEIRYELDLDRLHAAAIERGARARHQV